MSVSPFLFTDARLEEDQPGSPDIVFGDGVDWSVRLAVRDVDSVHNPPEPDDGDPPTRVTSNDDHYVVFTSLGPAPMRYWVFSLDANQRRKLVGLAHPQARLLGDTATGSDGLSSRRPSTQGSMADDFEVGTVAAFELAFLDDNVYEESVQTLEVIKRLRGLIASIADGTQAADDPAAAATAEDLTQELVDRLECVSELARMEIVAREIQAGEGEGDADSLPAIYRRLCDSLVNIDADDFLEGNPDTLRPLTREVIRLIRLQQDNNVLLNVVGDVINHTRTVRDAPGLAEYEESVAAIQPALRALVDVVKLRRLVASAADTRKEAAWEAIVPVYRGRVLAVAREVMQAAKALMDTKWRVLSAGSGTVDFDPLAFADAMRRILNLLRKEAVVTIDDLNGAPTLPVAPPSSGRGGRPGSGNVGRVPLSKRASLNLVDARLRSRSAVDSSARSNVNSARSGEEQSLDEVPVRSGRAHTTRNDSAVPISTGGKSRLSVLFESAEAAAIAALGGQVESASPRTSITSTTLEETVSLEVNDVLAALGLTEGDTGDDRSSNYTFETRLDDRLSTYSNISLDDRPLSFGSGPDGTLGVPGAPWSTHTVLAPLTPSVGTVSPGDLTFEAGRPTPINAAARERMDVGPKRVATPPPIQVRRSDVGGGSGGGSGVRVNTAEGQRALALRERIHDVTGEVVRALKREALKKSKQEVDNFMKLLGETAELADECGDEKLDELKTTVDNFTSRVRRLSLSHGELPNFREMERLTPIVRAAALEALGRAVVRVDPMAELPDDMVGLTESTLTGLLNSLTGRGRTNSGPLRPITPRASADNIAQADEDDAMTTTSANDAAVALFDCYADNPDELSFVAGTLITDIEETEDEAWLIGSVETTRGLIPAAFVRRVAP